MTTTTTTLDEVIYCGTVWLDANAKYDESSLLSLDSEIEDEMRHNAEILVRLCYERFRRSLKDYEALQAFEDTLEAQIAKEVAELMGDPR
jgi:hypothetical protein